MPSIESLSNAPGYGDYFIGFFDIMGFKDAVIEGFRDNDVRIYNTVTKVFEDIPSYILTGESKYYSPYPTAEPILRRPPSELITELIESSFFFSDSMFFACRRTEDDQENRNRFATLCAVINRFLRLVLIDPIDHQTIQSPLRGGIASGKAVVDTQKKIFFGPPIADAYELSEAQNWSGAAIHPSVDLEEMFGDQKDQLIGFDKLLYEYPAIPLDKNRRKYGKDVRYALNWVHDHYAWSRYYPYIEKNKPLGKDVIYHIKEVNWNGLMEKRNNTILFANAICDDFANSDMHRDSYSIGGEHYGDGTYSRQELMDLLKSYQEKSSHHN